MKTQAEIEEQIDLLKRQPAMQAPVATVDENAPLALTQTNMDGMIAALRWVLSGPEESK